MGAKNYFLKNLIGDKIIFKKFKIGQEKKILKFNWTKKSGNKKPTLKAG